MVRRQLHKVQSVYQFCLMGDTTEFSDSTTNNFHQTSSLTSAHTGTIDIYKFYFLILLLLKIKRLFRYAYCSYNYSNCISNWPGFLGIFSRCNWMNPCVLCQITLLVKAFFTNFALKSFPLQCEFVCVLSNHSFLQMLFHRFRIWSFSLQSEWFGVFSNDLYFHNISHRFHI